MGMKVLMWMIALIAIAIDGFTQNDKPIFKVLGDADTIYTTADVMPKFPKGDEGLLQYLDEVAFPLFFIEYLVFAEEGDWEGTVYIEFIINKDGTVGNAAISSSTGYGPLDTAGLQHVQGMPMWKPGKQNGKPVKVQKVVPVKFYYYDPPPPPPPPPLLTLDETPIVDDTPTSYPDDYVFSIVEEMPVFAKGDEAGVKYIANMPWPAEDKQYQGTVYVEYIIEKDGQVTNPLIIRSNASKYINDAVIAHILAMPKWERPGYQDGKPVRVRYVVPVKFKL